MQNGKLLTGALIGAAVATHILPKIVELPKRIKLIIKGEMVIKKTNIEIKMYL